VGDLCPGWWVVTNESSLPAEPADDDEAGELEAGLDADYAATVSNGDSEWLCRFREHFAAHPEDYAPLA
jgi:hypothetical protein